MKEKRSESADAEPITWAIRPDPMTSRALIKYSTTSNASRVGNFLYNLEREGYTVINKAAGLDCFPPSYSWAILLPQLS